MNWWWLATRIGVPVLCAAVAALQTLRLQIADENLARAHKALNEVTAKLSWTEEMWMRERDAVSERAARMAALEGENEAFAQGLAGDGPVGDDFWERLCRRPGEPAGDTAGSGDLSGGG